MDSVTLLPANVAVPVENVLIASEPLINEVSLFFCILGTLLDYIPRLPRKVPRGIPLK